MIYVHNRKKSVQYDPNKYTNELPIPLTTRGVHQAERNDSDSMWNLMNWCSQQPLDYIKYVCRYCGRKCEDQCSLARQQNKNFTRNTLSVTNPNDIKSYNDQVKQKLLQTKDQTQFVNSKKSVSFKQTNLGSQINTRKSRITQEPSSGSQIKPRKSRVTSEQVSGTQVRARQSRATQEPLSEAQREKLQQQAMSKQKYQRQCYSINKYLESLKPYTREMPNSAVRLFYDKPCLQSYGRKNVKNSGGVVYGDFMKTHNIQPHRHQNQPQKYQTYRSALNFGKRAKLDPQEKWRRIHRQMSSKLDLKQLVSDFSAGFIPIDEGNMNETLKGSINKLSGELFPRPKSVQNLRKVSAKSLEKQNSDLETTKGTTQNPLHSTLKRSKSWGKKEYLFLYKYKNKDGDVQYAKDRHGITCYVDPTFQENKQAYTKFLKKINPIQAEDVAPQDRNIDKIMIANYLKSKEEDLPRHYLMPNCDEPYRPQKFSIKGRKKLLSDTRATQASKE